MHRARDLGEAGEFLVGRGLPTVVAIDPATRESACGRGDHARFGRSQAYVTSASPVPDGFTGFPIAGAPRITDVGPMPHSSTVAAPSARHRAALGLLLRGDERRVSSATLATFARRGWVAAAAGGAYRLTVTGRALAESLEPAVLSSPRSR